MKLAKETLSKCVGDVNEIREKILPKNGNRKKRMSSFLQFILQDDHNVIEFEKMLRNNDLEDLLKIDENVQGEHIPTQGIGRLISYFKNKMTRREQSCIAKYLLITTLLFKIMTQMTLYCQFPYASTVKIHLV